MNGRQHADNAALHHPAAAGRFPVRAANRVPLTTNRASDRELS